MNVFVYRPSVAAGGLDRNGDPVDADGNVIRQTSPGTLVGTLAGVVLADPDVQSLSRGTDTGTVEGSATARGAFASIEALLGAPVGAAITLQHNDIVVTEQGVSFQLVGPRAYGRANVITGQPVRINGVYYYYLRAVALA